MYDTGKWAYNALDAVADTSKWARGVNALSAGGNAASQAKAEGADTSRALLYLSDYFHIMPSDLFVPMEE